MKWLTHLMNAPMAALIGLLSGVFFMIFLGSEVEEEIKRYGTYGLTACVSLFASGVALATAIWNTESQRERKLRAAKASLPLALSQFTDVCRNGFFVSLNKLSVHDEKRRGSNPLALGDEIVRILRDNIEYATPENASALCEIVSTYQILEARSKPDPSDFNSLDSKAQRAVDWLFLHSMVENCFDYGRDHVSTIELRDDDSSIVAMLATSFDLQSFDLGNSLRAKIEVIAGSMDCDKSYSISKPLY